MYKPKITNHGEGSTEADADVLPPHGNNG